MVETTEATCAEYVAKLNSSFSSGKTLPYEWRMTQLLAMRKMVKENDVAIIEAIGTDLGLRDDDTMAAQILDSRRFCSLTLCVYYFLLRPPDV